MAQVKQRYFAFLAILLLLPAAVVWAGETSIPDLTAMVAALPMLDEQAAAAVKDDWLVVPVDRKTGVYRSGPNEITMTNGLIRRTWRVMPNGACVRFDNLITGAALLRGVKPEARLQLDGKQYDIGGLLGQPLYAYLLPEWIDALTADPKAFQLVDFEVGQTKERFPWKRVRHAADLPWPPHGAALSLHFSPPTGSKLDNLTVSVHYEMYDGIPLVCKWMTIRNSGRNRIELESFVNEILAVVEQETDGVVKPGWEYPNIHVESDYAFNGATPLEADVSTNWLVDPQHFTQRWPAPALLESRPPLGPDAIIEPGATFETFRTFELIYDSTERERKGLALRRMYRTVAPWTTENPIMMHVRSAEPAAVRLAVDQCAEVGFEMVIMTFGSGLDMENDDSAYARQIKELVDYAHSKGVELGAYSLLSSRWDSGTENEVINPKTGKPGGAIFNQAPCIGSHWGYNYFRKLYAFYERTGMNLLEHDGSYPGDVCASTAHPGHRSLEDSQWTQWRTISDFYKWCRGCGVYLNVPDWYFLNGSNKVFLGYREENWSLPRQQQVILSRQNIFDGTWQKTPSMGWSFLPLVEYKGGGAEATIEPLAEHLDVYEAHLAQNFGSGIQSCYRGPRLFDTDATRAVVKKWVDFYKKYRPILESDIIHVRRPDGRDIDCMLHINPQLKQKGLAVVFNPLDRPVKRTLTLPLYYAGLGDTATVRQEEGLPAVYKLDRRYNIELPVEIGPRSMTWFVIE